MKRLLLTLFASAWLLSASAQIHCSDSIDTEDSFLEEVLVTGFVGKQNPRDAVHPFTIISPQKITHSVSMNLIDLVSHEPGVSQISTGTSISKPVIRGLGFNRVVVVSDGIRQEGQQWGEEHGLEVDGAAVGSMEVLKGPASLIYGSDAMAGVLLLHPCSILPQGEAKGYAETEYQSNNGLWGLNGGFSGNKNRFCWDWHLSEKVAKAYENRHDGKVNGSQFQQTEASGMFGWNRNWGRSHVRMSYFHLMPSIPSEEATGNGYRRSLPFQKVGHGKVVWDNLFYLGDNSLKVILGYQNNDRMEFEESRNEASLAMNMSTLTYDLQYKMEETGHWGVTTGMGGMYQHSQNRGEERLIPNYGLFDAGLYATGSRRFGEWNLSGGLRGDVRHLTLGNNFTGLTGSIGTVWNTKSGMNLRANFSRGFRAPGISELSSDGVHEGSYRYEKGNLDLKSEYSWQGDIGADYTRKHWGVNAALFANSIENYIYQRKLQGVLTDGYSTYQYQQGNAVLFGGEISVDVHPIRRLHIQNGFSYVRGMQLNVSEEEKDLPLIPAPRWNGEVRYECTDDIYVALNVESNFRQNHYYKLDGTETATPAYSIVDFSTCMDIHHNNRLLAHLLISVNNIFDKVYQNHLSRLKYAETPDGLGYFGMGRNVCVKMRFPID